MGVLRGLNFSWKADRRYVGCTRNGDEGPTATRLFLLHSKRCKVYTTNREYSKWVNDATHTPKWPKGNPGTHHRASIPIILTIRKC